jgi:hypothetical protein
MKIETWERASKCAWKLFKPDEFAQGIEGSRLTTTSRDLAEAVHLWMTIA